MELSDLQSTYEYYRGRLSDEVRIVLCNRYMYVESVLPWVYGDCLDYQIFGDDKISSEVRDLAGKLNAIISKKAKRSCCFKKMTFDNDYLEPMQNRYNELRCGLSKWAARLVEYGNLQDIKSLVPWIEGRYISFTHLHNPNTRMSKEMDEVVMKLQDFLAVLQREQMVKDAGFDTVNERTKRILVQNRFESILPDLSSRARKVLADNGMLSVDALWPWIEGRETDFLKLKGCGVGTNPELQEMVQGFIDYIKSLVPDSQIEDTIEPAIVVSEPLHQHELLPAATVERPTDNTDKELQKVYVEMLGKLSMRACNVLQNNGINDVDGFLKFMNHANMDFNRLKKCGKKTSDELMAMANAICVSRERGGIPIRKTGSMTYSPERLVFLQSGIDKWLYGKSVRTRRMLRSYGLVTIQALIPYLLDPDLKAPVCRQSKTTQVRADYEELLGMLRTYLINTALGGKENVSHEEPVPLSSMAGFSEEENAFARNFKAVHKHWPVFYLLKNYFKNTDDPNEQVFATIWGLNSGRVMSLDNAARVLGYSRESVRQKIVSMVEKPSSVLRNFFVQPDWQKYQLQQRNLLVYGNELATEDVGMVCNGEHIENGCTVLALMQFFGFELFFVDKKTLALSRYANSADEVCFAVKKDYANFNFRLAIKEAAKLKRQQRERYVKVNIKTRFVKDKRFWGSTLQMNRCDTDAIVSILSECFATILDVDVKDGDMLLTSNKANYSEELYWILKTAGVRLHISEIIKRLLEQYPNCPYTKPYQIKYYLKLDSRILNVGKSSYWELREWGNPVGSIREIAFSVAERAKRPLTVDDLVQKVLEFRPDSNARSVRAIVQQCIKNGELQYVNES